MCGRLWPALGAGITDFNRQTANNSRNAYVFWELFVSLQAKTKNLRHDAKLQTLQKTDKDNEEATTFTRNVFATNGSMGRRRKRKYKWNLLQSIWINSRSNKSSK
jgi:hypothetical protein